MRPRVTRDQPLWADRRAFVIMAMTMAAAGPVIIVMLVALAFAMPEMIAVVAVIVVLIVIMTILALGAR